MERKMEILGEDRERKRERCRGERVERETERGLDFVLGFWCFVSFRGRGYASKAHLYFQKPLGLLHSFSYYIIIFVIKTN